MRAEWPPFQLARTQSGPVHSPATHTQATGSLIDMTAPLSLLPCPWGLTCTPGCVSCMNSNSLLTTVLRNFQCWRRNLGYWPTTYLRAAVVNTRTW